MLDNSSLRQTGAPNVPTGMTQRGMKVKIPRSAPSIPSKFETNLYAGEKEKNAFGCRVDRFKNTKESLPGPGEYLSLDNELKQTTSLSKKGYGNGFVSKSQRFDFLGGNANPGPGEYIPLGRFDIDKEHPTSTFRTHTTKPRIQKQKIEPGPGSYDYIEKNKSLKKPSAVFRSTSERNPEPIEILPGPGEYTKDTFPPIYTVTHLNTSTSSNSNNNNNSSNGSNAVFKSKVQRDLLSGIYKTPGPGQYNPSLDISKIQNVGPSSSFQPGPGRIEFARRDYPVGPGSYDVGYYEELKKKIKMPIANSAFVSNVTRSGLDKSKLRNAAPGPAYYTVQGIPDHESFILNQKRLWL